MPLHSGDGIEFDLVAIVQFADGDDGSCRTVVAEELGVHSIDLRPVADIGHIDGDANHSIATATGGDEDGIEVGESLPGLFFDGAEAVFLLPGLDGELACDVNHTLMDDGLGIVARGNRGFVGEDRLQVRHEGYFIQGR